MNALDLNEGSAVASFVEAYPASVTALVRMEIDFCAQGDRPLNSICAERGLDPEVVMRVLTSGTEVGPGTGNEWHTLSSTGLVDYLISTHHRFLKRELPRLRAVLDAVVRGHGSGHPELLELERVFGALHKEISEHLYKEEAILFPAIKMIDRGTVPAMRAPLIVMLEEHYHAGESLRRIRRLANGYAVPADATRSYKSLLKGLQVLEYDLCMHMHKENNVLFPRVFSQVEKLEAGAQPEPVGVGAELPPDLGAPV